MPHILKNKHIEIHIDLPDEGYQLSRFDWTGKITALKFKNKLVSGVERTDVKSNINFGKGFYNEFGIETPVGFDDLEIGGWFHKIGIGLLKKDNETYDFFREYELIPARCEIIKNDISYRISCISKITNGYGYILDKRVELKDNGFEIHYKLYNAGTKTINTEEYNHNFLCINKDKIGPNYELNFPFKLDSSSFNEFLNEEKKLIVHENGISFNHNPEDQFFISNLSGSKLINASWELINSEKKISIQEQVDFETDKINLWGWRHVISPEIFFLINLKPNETVSWTRKYIINEIN
jgi:hypothetical protein